ncbi:protein-tyrosine phosphatase-like protein [Boletus reticuloceps]|uniref:protein-tyrosine-phosphatase n=1 Tax=Boletus reticuloceps TaxID=495285 RepID=A0A8I3AEH5_9AGAM|nr:protein-tyrosine phosphatase-like protein [Boletus reticuloceps]
MIRFEGMTREVMEAMCTPMHQILPTRYPHSSSPTIRSVNQISSTGMPSGNLFLGSMSATMDHELLKRHHITHVVQVIDGPWIPISEKDGFLCLRIDIHDKPSADLKPHLEGACQYIATALASGGNVLVHCQQGISRSPAIVIAYLIYNLGLSYDHAHALVKRHRPCVNPNPGFVAALRAWENKWRSTTPPPPQFRRANTSYVSLGSGGGAIEGDVVVSHPPPFARGMSFSS